MRLPPSEVHVWLADPDAGDADLARARGLLDGDERRREARLRTPALQRRFALSHALVRDVLSRYAAVEPAAWRFRRGAHGRPELAEPWDRHGLHFNLSHTEGLAACAVARNRDVGVDAELARRVRDPAGLADRFFAPAEAAALRALPAGQQRERFLDLWTLKEAYMKARGLGFALRLRDVAFELSDAGPTLVPGAGLDDDPSAWQFELRALPGGRRLAVALRRGDGTALSVRRFDAATGAPG